MAINNDKKPVGRPTGSAKKKKKPPTLKEGTKRVEVYEGVECYLTPRQIKYCKNFAANGGVKSKAAKDAGYSKNYVWTIAFKANKYIPIYIEKLKTEFLEFDEREGETSENYADHIKRHIGKNILKRLVDIVNFRANRVQRWDNEGVEFFPVENISIEDLSAIKSVISETTEYHGKNPRKTIKMKLEIYDGMQAMKELRDMVGIDYKKDQDATFLLEQLKHMLVDQKLKGILPTAPTPETDVTLLKCVEEEDIPLSEVTKH